MNEGVLVRWVHTFSDSHATHLHEFCDGAILLCVAQDTMEGLEGINFGALPEGLPGLLLALEQAYEVRFFFSRGCE
jgi:hypothetical protein